MSRLTNIEEFVDKIVKINDYELDLTDWEESFMKSIKNFKALSDKQIDIIER